MNDRYLGSCHCGAVRLSVPHIPDQVTRCNCSLCTKLGTRWLYFRPDEIDISGPLEEYVRRDLMEPALATQRCQSCGTIIGWRAFDPDYQRAGVNANLFDPIVIETLPIQLVNGWDWDQ